MKTLQRAACAMLWGAIVGGITLGVGGRLVMRLLALRKDLQPVFSVGGSLEVVAYGAIVGAATALALLIAVRKPTVPLWLGGAATGLLAYAATIATLPDHIAQTVRPFAGEMTIVLVLFGICFLVFGYALWWLRRQGANQRRQQRSIDET